MSFLSSLDEIFELQSLDPGDSLSSINDQVRVDVLLLRTVIDSLIEKLPPFLGYK